MSTPYVGRFAPSPSGALHDGSLVAAMASYLDAKAHRGKWLLRIEDIDTPRVVKGADALIMQQLHALGMQWDGNPIWQSDRLPRYEACLTQLQQKALVYPCSCTRKEIMDYAQARGHFQGQYPYLGKCRQGTSTPTKAWRLIMPEGQFEFTDRWEGIQSQNIQDAIGDIIIRRADGLFAYQLVVVIDDHDQGVTDIVRGQDLLDSTQRQQCIAHYLGFSPFRYMHVPLLLDKEGRKLSKQNHAPAICTDNALASLQKAWQALGFSPLNSDNVADFWAKATQQWANRFSIFPTS